MFRPEMIKDHWTTLSPKIRELWPNLSEQDVQEINGDVEVLVSKVSAKYNIGRDEILDKLMKFVPVPAEKPSVAKGTD
jgi:uncharacterized protein YjbJ (UPF0337 family)